MTAERIDVIGVMLRAEAEAKYDTYQAGVGFVSRAREEIYAARGAMKELIEAASAYYHGYCVDEAEDTFDMSRRGTDTGCDRDQHEAAKRLRDALARIGAA